MPLMTCIDIVYLWSSRLALCVTQLLCWGQMPRPTLTGLAVSTTRSNLIKVSHFINVIFSGKNAFILAVKCCYCASRNHVFPAHFLRFLRFIFAPSTESCPTTTQVEEALRVQASVRQNRQRKLFNKGKAKLCKAMQSCVECASNCAWWEFHVDVCNFTMYLQVCKCHKCQIFNHFQELATRCNKQLFVCLSWSCWNKEVALQKRTQSGVSMFWVWLHYIRYESWECTPQWPTTPTSLTSYEPYESYKSYKSYDFHFSISLALDRNRQFSEVLGMRRPLELQPQLQEPMIEEPRRAKKSQEPKWSAYFVCPCFCMSCHFCSCLFISFHSWRVTTEWCEQSEFSTHTLHPASSFGFDSILPRQEAYRIHPHTVYPKEVWTLEPGSLHHRTCVLQT